MATDRERKGNARSSASKLALLLMVMVIFVAMSGVAHANRITDYFSSYASSTEPGLLDFLVFSVIFIAICWIGFSGVFGKGSNVGSSAGGNGAVIALAVALGFGLSAALVYGAKFTLKSILPISVFVLALIAFLGIFVLLRKTIFTGDTGASKFWAFLVAIIISIILVVVAVYFICGNDRCNTGFLSKMFGPESFIGGLFSGIKDVAETPADTGALPPGTVSLEKCGNGQIDGNERCDPGMENQGCGPPQICYDCDHCAYEGDIAAAGGKLEDAGNFVVSNLDYILPAIVLLVIGFFIIRHVRKKKADGSGEDGDGSGGDGSGGGDGDLPTPPKEGFIGKVNDIIGEMREALKEQLKQLTRNLETEKSILEESKMLSDEIFASKTDVIDRGNLELLTTGKGIHLRSAFEKFGSLNNSEKHMIGSFMLPKMQDAIREISEVTKIDERLLDAMSSSEGTEPTAEMKAAIDNVKNIEKEEMDHITAVMRDLREEAARLIALQSCCDTMEEHITRQIGVFKTANSNISNAQLDKTMHALFNATRSNIAEAGNTFSKKVEALHSAIQEYKELKQNVLLLHRAQVHTLSEMLEESKQMIRDVVAAGETMTADAKRHDMVYSVKLLSVVIQSSIALRHEDLDSLTKSDLENLETEARSILQSLRPDKKKKKGSPDSKSAFAGDRGENKDAPKPVTA